jgi:hypothetical protein
MYDSSQNNPSVACKINKLAHILKPRYSCKYAICKFWSCKYYDACMYYVLKYNLLMQLFLKLKPCTCSVLTVVNY